MGRRISTPSRSSEQAAAQPRDRRAAPAPRLRVQFNWRWVSAGLVLLIGVGALLVFINPAFYVTRAEVGGLRYTPPEEIFTRAGIATWHILYLDPAQIEARLIESPSIADVEVQVQWPARVIILARERQPALVWQQGNEQYWVDVNGILMLKRAGLPELVLVINTTDSIPFRCPGPACNQPDGTVSIEPAVVQGAQQLKTLRPDLGVLYYDPVRGLSFDDARGWRGYFGIGTDMARKLQIYESLIGSLIGRGIAPRAIDVSDPEAPVYRR